MDYLFQDGGKPKKANSKTGTKTTKSKTSTKTGDKAKKTSNKKGGNFLGVVGDLVAPTGWETFATTAGLFALDRADAALRRGKSTKNSAKKGGMWGGSEKERKLSELYSIKSTLDPKYKERIINIDLQINNLKAEIQKNENNKKAASNARLAEYLEATTEKRSLNNILKTYYLQKDHPNAVRELYSALRLKKINENLIEGIVGKATGREKPPFPLQDNNFEKKNYWKYNKGRSVARAMQTFGL
jgi:hypothetical protein